MGLGVQAPSSAVESDTVTSEPGLAKFEGKTIDLSEGWGEARSCVVHSPEQVKCYRTREQADKVLGYDPTQDPKVAASAYKASAASVPSCPKAWICLYKDAGGEGRRLQFNDEYWHSLSAYGFAHETSSWRNIQDGNWLCNDRGVLGNGNGGAYYMDDCAYANQLGKYNDWAVDVHG
ncbi:peptidase inhibitor family I36 protein [Actinopolyspora biskrensis]